MNVADVKKAAASLKWTRKMPRWVVMVNGNAVPMRPLYRDVTGLTPNKMPPHYDIVDQFKEAGFEVRYDGQVA